MQLPFDPWAEYSRPRQQKPAVRREIARLKKLLNETDNDDTIQYIVEKLKKLGTL